MEKKTKTCPYCQKELPVETNFCWYCTRQLEARPERPEVQPKPSAWTTGFLIAGLALLVVIGIYILFIAPLAQ
jgi:predicted amidophosphoribosyltransferase